MLEVHRSIWFWRERWHVYDVDTGGTVWLATFRRPTDATDWVRRHYNADQ